MPYIEILEKVFTLASGHFLTWPHIIANIIACILFLIVPPIAISIYGTLDTMKDTLIHISFWLFIISIYVAIHKITSDAFAWGAKIWEDKKSRLRTVQEETIFKASIDSLSAKEIALIKFLLKMDVPAAWLPNEYLPVILLEEKRIIRCVDILKSKIIPLKHGSSITTICHVYQLTSGAQKTIHEHLLLNTPAWKKIKPDNTFRSFQED